MQIPPSSKQEWDAENPEEESKLKRNEYYLLDMGSIISNTREYSAVENCKANPLMESIVTNDLRGYFQYKKTLQFNARKEDLFTKLGS